MSNTVKSLKTATELSDRIFSIRSDRIITIIVNEESEQIALPKFIKRSNLDSMRTKLDDAIEKAIKQGDACILINVVGKTDHKIAGVYVKENTIHFIPKEQLERHGEIAQGYDIEYTDCEALFLVKK